MSGPRRRLHRVLLAVYARLPRSLRRRAVRLLQPTFVVGAVCAVEHEGRWLVVRHSYRDAWGAVGGGLSRGEVPAAAGIREAMEEVGLAIEPVEEARVVVDASARRVDVALRCRLAAGASPADAVPRSPEILEVRWVPAAELRGLSMQRETRDAFRVLGILQP